MTQISLGANIAPSFRSVHHAVWNHERTHFWLMGGRGSTKSTFAAIQTVLAIIRDPNINAVVVRKVGNTLRDSCYAQLLSAMDLLGVAEEFHCSVSPMEMTYKPTSQRILFRGADKPEKLKSITTRVGYVGVVWYEELDQFYGMEEIRSINQSLLRGGEVFTVFYTYNPPKSRDSWVNREALIPRDDRRVHQSTYLDVPRHWLGEQFFAEADDLFATKPDAYRHEYLGEITGTGGAVFENLDIRTITDAEVAEFDRLYNGVDFGYFPDPWCFERVHFDAARKTLYLFSEATANKASNAITAEIVKAALTYGPADTEPTYHREMVVCDSAEPKSIDDYRMAGLDARAVAKGPGSVEYGMKWLQALDHIVIDPRRCPLAADEFPMYEYERTRDGEYCSVYPDKHNHSIDATRYALSTAIMRRGAL